MFRQVVACRWAEGVHLRHSRLIVKHSKGLRSIPELLLLTWGDDAGHFDDNFDLVAVMDFSDFAAARRYVDH
jgi:hypothetical protein